MRFRLSARKPLLLAREDWILLSLAAAKRSLNQFQLEKLLRLLGQEFPKLAAGLFYNSDSISGGQFSADVRRDVNLLAMLHQIAINVTEDGREYRLTPQGLQRALDLEERADPDAMKFLHRTALWVRTRSVDQLLNAAAEPAPAAPPAPTPRHEAPPLRRR